MNTIQQSGKSLKNTVEPVLIGTVFSRHPLLSGHGYPIISLNELFLLCRPVLNGHKKTIKIE